MVNNISGVLKTYEVYKNEDRHLTQKITKPDELKDTVAISGKAMDYQNARNALGNIPDIREDLVLAARKKYESNANAVSDSDIAEKIAGKI